MVQLKVFKQNESAQLPAFETEGAACFDLRASLVGIERVAAYNSMNKLTTIMPKLIGGELSVQIPPQTRVAVPTGLIFDIPVGFEMKVFMRSGAALKKGLTLINNVGVIDSDYVNEVFLTLYNTTDVLVNVSDGERVCQGQLVELVPTAIVETETAPEQKTSRSGGLGSTGTK